MSELSSQPEAGASPPETLRDVRETERLGPYSRGMWNRREWSWYVAASELRSRQIDSVLGNLWHLLNPLLQVAVFFIFFGLLLEADRGIDNFIAFLTIGIFVYTFTQKATLAGGASMTRYRQLIELIAFPRAIVPLTATLTETLAALPGYLVIFTVVAVTGEPITTAWLLTIPLFAVQTIFNAGLALIAARAVSHLFDIQQVLPFIFRLGFYVSGVLFSLNAYLDNPTYLAIFEFNPIYCFIELNRGFLLDGHGVNWSLALTALGWTAATFVLGLIWFRRAEDTYGSE